MTYFPTEERDGTVIITLTNGERNTLNPDLLEEGAATLQRLATDPPKAGIVLTGAGEHFTCGMDTKIAASLDEAGQKRAVAGINDFAGDSGSLAGPGVAAAARPVLAFAQSGRIPDRRTGGRAVHGRPIA